MGTNAEVANISDQKGYHMSRQEVGDELGLSQQVVWHIERRALEKMRREFKQRGLSLEDLVEA